MFVLDFSSSSISDEKDESNLLIDFIDLEADDFIVLLRIVFVFNLVGVELLLLLLLFSLFEGFGLFRLNVKNSCFLFILAGDADLTTRLSLVVATLLLLSLFEVVSCCKSVSVEINENVSFSLGLLLE